MIRSSKLSANRLNVGKKTRLLSLMDEMTKVVNTYIDILWEEDVFKGRYVGFKVNSWLSARVQSCLGKQALEIVKSQRKKPRHLRTKPVFRGGSFTLDARVFDLDETAEEFDFFLRIKSIGDKSFIKIPLNRHKHFNKFEKWDRLNSVRLLRKDGNIKAEFFFHKEPPALKKKGKVIGFDCGYKKMLVSSEGKVIGQELEAIYEKIARKQQGSAAFKRALVERDNLINQLLNTVSFRGIREVVVEALKNVKRSTKGKIRKDFMNKLQRWAYPKVLSKLSRLAEEKGILFTEVNPSYTSQKCSKCGVVNKSNRRLERYHCKCGNNLDADFNAAINISRLGVYSPQPTKN